MLLEPAAADNETSSNSDKVFDQMHARNELAVVDKLQLESFTRWQGRVLDASAAKTRGRVRAGPSFQLGTLPTPTDRRLVFPTRCFSAAAAENHRVGKTRRRSIYSADRQTRDRHDLPASQSDSTQLKAGNVTLTFDLLTPKPNQFVFVPGRTTDKSLAKKQSVGTGNIAETYSLGLTDALTDGRTDGQTDRSVQSI